MNQTVFSLKLGSLLRALSIPVLLLQGTIAAAIDPPLNLRAQIIDQTQVVWEWDSVSGAIQYEVVIDGLNRGLTPNANYRSNDLWPGEHSISVKAVDLNGQFSAFTQGIKINTLTDASSDANSNDPAKLNTASGDGPIDANSYNYPEVYEKPGYELSFSDEFNDDRLNPEKWNTQLRWDGEFNGERFEYRMINGEEQFYVNIFSDDPEHLTTVVPSYNPFEFDGSRLAIRATRNPLKTTNDNADHGPLSAMVAQQEFLSGAITTYDKFTQKYGYFEARLKIPSHVGTFPAFWLHHQRRANENTRRTEIDIMENLGHAPWYIYNSFHHFDNVSATYSGDANFVKPLPEGQIYTGIDYSLDYHTYAVEWEPGYIAWFIDGQKVSEITNSNVDHEELYVLLNLAMGGYWTNFPENAGGLGRDRENFFPNFDDLNNFSNPALEIDYVRVYKKQ